MLSAIDSLSFELKLLRFQEKVILEQHTASEIKHTGAQLAYVGCLLGFPLQGSFERVSMRAIIRALNNIGALMVRTGLRGLCICIL